MTAHTLTLLQPTDSDPGDCNDHAVPITIDPLRDDGVRDHIRNALQPLMRRAFQDDPISAEEARHLVTRLQSALRLAETVSQAGRGADAATVQSAVRVML